MDSLEIIKKYYKPTSKNYYYLVTHSRAVANKAVKIAKGCPHSVDEKFIFQAAMLHDIGIFMTHAPRIGCYGEHSYICHGWLGGELLRKEGFSRQARVCERHIGTGLRSDDIKDQKLPLPPKDMVPKTEEEEIISLADLFFSKSHEPIDQEQSFDHIRRKLKKFGHHKVAKFDSWVKKYNL